MGAIVSMEGPALISFGLVGKAARPDLPSRLELLLRPRSLLLFRGDAYELYVHSVPHTVEDTVGTACCNLLVSNAVLGEVVRRAPRRTSVTLRRIRHVRV